MFTKRSSTFPTGRVRALHCLIYALTLCFIALTSQASAADKLALSDRRAIEATIRQQLDAFGRDDAETAFGYATPDIQRMFGSSDNFLHMVRESYQPVYRSADVQFVRLEAVGGQWVQTVQLVDGEGRVWRALFTMKRQPDKTWKVGGCQLVQTRALAT